MPYIKISDPNIIDLAAWHQVVNVINQHSDSIASLTNNFGLSWSPDYDGDDWSSPFDFGSQQIVYGKAKLDINKNDGATLSEEDIGGTMSWVIEQPEISFSQTFSSKPVVIATVVTSTTNRFDAVVTVSNITTSNFTARVSNLTSEATTATINWVAIGPK